MDAKASILLAQYESWISSRVKNKVVYSGGMRSFFIVNELKGVSFEEVLKDRQAECSDAFRFVTNKFFAFLREEYPGVSIRLENDLWNPYTKQRNYVLLHSYFEILGKVPPPAQYCSYLNKCINELLVEPRYNSLNTLARSIYPRQDYTLAKFVFKKCLLFIKWLEANPKIARDHFNVNTEDIWCRITLHASEAIPASWTDRSKNKTQKAI